MTSPTSASTIAVSPEPLRPTIWQQTEGQAQALDVPQNQQTPCELQAGTHTRATNTPNSMPVQNPNTPLADPAESLQQAGFALSEDQVQSSKDESEAIAVTSLSIADSVDQTSHAGGGIQLEQQEGNPLDERPSAQDAEITLENPVQAEFTKNLDAQETASAFEPLPASPPIGSYPVLDDLQELLGNKVVLIPIPEGKKAPVTKGWQNITQSQMQNLGYQAQLANGNIGVLLGAASNGLCAIDIDSDRELEAFLDLNPALRKTLITRGARGAQIWCVVQGEYPPLTKLKTETGEDYGEWRADGGQSVVHGVHPSGVHYQRINDAPPVIISFSQIIWPEHVKLPWVKDASDEIVDKYGPPYTFDPGFKINEFYFAARFQLERRVLWEPLEREFYEYRAKSGLWVSISTEAMKLQLGLDLKRVSDETGLDNFIFARTDGRMAGWLNTLKGMAEEQDAFKKNTRKVIHCNNGMLDLGVHPPELKTFHPDYRSRNASPFAFDPEAECPGFINGLLRPALDGDDLELLQLWAGGVLLGENPAQRLLIITGTPGGGKSTVIEILEKIIGEQNVAQIRTEHLGKQFEMYKFLGKTLLTGKDVDPGFLSERHASILKALVGNDLLDAEKKNGNEHFQLRGCFNMAITCNSRLTVRLKGDVGAWERRILLLQYDRPKPEKRITDYASKLIRDEGSGILNWAIEGAVKYLAEVEEFGDIRLTPAQSERVQILLNESDSLSSFVETRVIKAPLHDITGEELRTGYLDFCEEMGWRSFEQREVNAQMSDLMMQTHNVRQRHDISRGLETKRGYKGVRIVEGGAH
jgi:P4 family phage/plasmid primase-like protien